MNTLDDETKKNKTIDEVLPPQGTLNSQETNRSTDAVNNQNGSTDDNNNHDNNADDDDVDKFLEIDHILRPECVKKYEFDKEKIRSKFRDKEKIRSKFRAIEPKSQIQMNLGNIRAVELGEANGEELQPFREIDQKDLKSLNNDELSKESIGIKKYSVGLDKKKKNVYDYYIPKRNYVTERKGSGKFCGYVSGVTKRNSKKREQGRCQKRNDLKNGHDFINCKINISKKNNNKNKEENCAVRKFCDFVPATNLKLLKKNIPTCVYRRRPKLDSNGKEIGVHLTDHPYCQYISVKNPKSKINEDYRCVPKEGISVRPVDITDDGEKQNKLKLKTKRWESRFSKNKLINVAENAIADIILRFEKSKQKSDEKNLVQRALFAYIFDNVFSMYIRYKYIPFLILHTNLNRINKEKDITEEKHNRKTIFSGNVMDQIETAKSLLKIANNTNYRALSLKEDLNDAKNSIKTYLEKFNSEANELLKQNEPNYENNEDVKADKYEHPKKLLPKQFINIFVPAKMAAPELREEVPEIVKLYFKIFNTKLQAEDISSEQLDLILFTQGLSSENISVIFPGKFMAKIISQINFFEKKKLKNNEKFNNLRYLRKLLSERTISLFSEQFQLHRLKYDDDENKFSNIQFKDNAKIKNNFEKNGFFSVIFTTNNVDNNNIIHYVLILKNEIQILIIELVTKKNNTSVRFTDYQYQQLAFLFEEIFKKRVSNSQNETTNNQNETTNSQNETTNSQNETTNSQNETTNSQNETTNSQNKINYNIYHKSVDISSKKNKQNIICYEIIKQLSSNENKNVNEIEVLLVDSNSPREYMDIGKELIMQPLEYAAEDGNNHNNTTDDFDQRDFLADIDAPFDPTAIDTFSDDKKQETSGSSRVRSTTKGTFGETKVGQSTSSDQRSTTQQFPNSSTTGKMVTTSDGKKTEAKMDNADANKDQQETSGVDNADPYTDQQETSGSNQVISTTKGTSGETKVGQSTSSNQRSTTQQFPNSSTTGKMVTTSNVSSTQPFPTGVQTRSQTNKLATENKKGTSTKKTRKMDQTSSTQQFPAGVQTRSQTKKTATESKKRTSSETTRKMDQTSTFQPSTFGVTTRSQTNKLATENKKGTSTKKTRKMDQTSSTQQFPAGVQTRSQTKKQATESKKGTSSRTTRRQFPFSNGPLNQGVTTRAQAQKAQLANEQDEDNKKNSDTKQSRVNLGVTTRAQARARNEQKKSPSRRTKKESLKGGVPSNGENEIKTIYQILGPERSKYPRLHRFLMAVRPFLSMELHLIHQSEQIHQRIIDLEREHQRIIDLKNTEEYKKNTEKYKKINEEILNDKNVLEVRWNHIQKSFPHRPFIWDDKQPLELIFKNAQVNPKKNPTRRQRLYTATGNEYKKNQFPKKDDLSKKLVISPTFNSELPDTISDILESDSDFPMNEINNQDRLTKVNDEAMDLVNNLNLSEKNKNQTKMFFNSADGVEKNSPGQSIQPYLAALLNSPKDDGAAVRDNPSGEDPFKQRSSSNGKVDKNSSSNKYDETKKDEDKSKKTPEKITENQARNLVKNVEIGSDISYDADEIKSLSSNLFSSSENAM